MPVTTLLKALGLTSEEILATFYNFESFHVNSKKVELELVPERLRGDVAKFNITDKKGNIIVALGKRITVKHVRDIEKSGVKTIPVDYDFLEGRKIAKEIIDKETGEVIAKTNAEITSETSKDGVKTFALLDKIFEAGIDSFNTVYSNDLDHGDFISQTLSLDAEDLK